MDVYLSDVRDQAAAGGFFEQEAKATGITLEQITTDKEPAFFPAIKNIFCALIFCTAFEEIRQLFHMKNKTRSERLGMFLSKFQEINLLLATAA